MNHIHLKSLDPRRAAAWYAEAFRFKVLGESVRPQPYGDLMVRCEPADGGISVLISGPRTGEALGPGDASAHLGLEHFGVEVDDIDSELARLTGLGATVLEGPLLMASGLRIAFIRAPGDVRIEILQRPAEENTGRG